MSTSNTTACNVPFPYPSGGCTCPQGGWWSVTLPPPCPVHSRYTAPVYPYITPPAEPMTPADVERIARRVAELLREAKP